MPQKCKVLPQPGGLTSSGEDLECPQCSKVVQVTDGNVYICPECKLDVQQYSLMGARENHHKANKGPHPETAAEKFSALL